MEWQMVGVLVAGVIGAGGLAGGIVKWAVNTVLEQMRADMANLRADVNKLDAKVDGLVADINAVAVAVARLEGSKKGA